MRSSRPRRVDLVPQYAASALAQQRLLVDNPTRLYGFA
jgi:hypothetical protein